MTAIIRATLVASLVGLLAGCATTQDDTTSARLRVRSFIDGADSLIVRGDQIWFEHHAYELPGRWMGGDEPTIINGEYEWRPVWTGSVSDRFRIPDPESALPPNRSFDADTLRVTHRGGWGSVVVSQYPAADNGYTLIVTIDDRGPEGATWYTVGIDWD